MAVARPCSASGAGAAGKAPEGLVYGSEVVLIPATQETHGIKKMKRRTILKQDF